MGDVKSSSDWERGREWIGCGEWVRGLAKEDGVGCVRGREKWVRGKEDGMRWDGRVKGGG